MEKPILSYHYTGYKTAWMADGGEYLMFADLVLRNRSYRRFDGSFALSRETLRDLVGLARLTASASNRQPLKFFISNEKESNKQIFSCLTWAAQLKDWDGPSPQERPTAYIMLLGDNDISKKIEWDHGIAAQTILLGAAEQELGGCIFATVDRERLRRNLAVPERYRILLVIALGKPVEKVVIETAGDDILYWRDAAGVHHVPKRPLEEIILNFPTPPPV